MLFAPSLAFLSLVSTLVSHFSSVHSAPIPVSPSPSRRFLFSDELNASDWFPTSGPSSWNASSTTPPRAQTLSSRDTAADLETIRKRRLSIAVASINASTVPDIPSWVSSLGGDGKWPDSEVDYTTGCSARRANWLAEDHWVRIETMAAAWHGGLAGAEQLVGDAGVLAATQRAMDWWFDNDFTASDCLTNGGNGNCPCGTPGMWNPNWFSNVIGVPRYVGDACLLLGPSTLSASQRAGCTRSVARAFGTFGSGASFLAGANVLDVAKTGVAWGLLAGDASAVADAYARVHAEVVLHDALHADGIRADGSFGQHGGILYNGNYGKDYANDVLALELAAAGTQFEADDKGKAAFETLMDGDQWMIYQNTKTGTNHWDFSVLQRMITFAVSDEQATASILVNVSMIGELGQLWGSEKLQSIASGLESSSTDANVGQIKGNRMFYANDYMVHRGSGYVSTLRMFSSRTLNSECLNDQNPFGFHLSDGTLYTYVEGDEYEDIAAMWDWNMIPGTTTDYSLTPLSCDKVQFAGKEAFVGGASDGTVGAAAMRYRNPDTGALSFQKAWFFLDDDIQHIMISHAQTTSADASSTAPLISVLDQKRHAGPVLVDGQPLAQSGNVSKAATLWHADVGYAFPGGAALSVDFGPRTGDWGALGISDAGTAQADLFAAWISHGRAGGAVLELPMAYTAFPGTSADAFPAKAAGAVQALKTVQNDASVSAVYDAAHQTAMAVFWDAAGGEVTVKPQDGGAPPVTIKASAGAIVLYRMDTGEVTVADPTQSLGSVDVTVTPGSGGGARPKGLESGGRTVSVKLPSGGAAGQSVTQTLS